MNIKPIKPFIIFSLIIICSIGFTLAQAVSPIKACSEVKDTIDPAKHSCCVPPPPSSVNVLWGDYFELSADSGSSPEYFPLSGMLMPNGSFLLENQSNVAGFDNIKTEFKGKKIGNLLEGDIIVGADGGLPENQPITFKVVINTGCNSSCVGRFQGNGLTFDFDNELKGTFQVAGQSGSLFAVNQYDMPGDICFFSSFVTLPLPDGSNCDMVLSGRLNVMGGTGGFDFGGGNFCAGGIVPPFSLELAKTN